MAVVAGRSTESLGVMRLVGIFVAILVCVIATIWGGDVLVDRSMSIAIVSDAPLYALPPQDYPANNPKVGTLRRGDPVKVTRSGYGKDFQAFRVETPSGQTGWVILGNGVERRG